MAPNTRRPKDASPVADTKDLVRAANVDRADRNGVAVSADERLRAERNPLDNYLTDKGMDGASRALKGTGLDPEAFLRAVTSVTLTSSMKVSPDAGKRAEQYRSVLVAAMNIATLGLHPAPQLGQAWLVPFWDRDLGAHKMQLIVGYQGYVTLAGRAAWTMKVEPIWKGQEYQINLLDPAASYLLPLTRTPDPGETPEMMAFVARSQYGSHVDARPYNWYLNARERSESYRRDRQKGTKHSPWSTDELAMVAKTVIRWERKFVPAHDPTSLPAMRLAAAYHLDGTVGGRGEVPSGDPMDSLMWTPDRFDTDEPGVPADRVADLSDSAILSEIATYHAGEDCAGVNISSDVDTLISSHGLEPGAVVPVLSGEDGPVPPRELLIAVLEMCRTAASQAGEQQ